MVNEMNLVAEGVADVSFRGGCPICSGDVQVRVSPLGGHLYCGTCHLLTQPHVRRSSEGLALELRPTARA